MKRQEMLLQLKQLKNKTDRLQAQSLIIKLSEMDKGNNHDKAEEYSQYTSLYVPKYIANILAWYQKSSPEVKKLLLEGKISARKVGKSFEGKSIKFIGEKNKKLDDDEFEITQTQACSIVHDKRFEALNLDELNEEQINNLLEPIIAKNKDILKEIKLSFRFGNTGTISETVIYRKEN